MASWLFGPLLTQLVLPLLWLGGVALAIDYTYTTANNTQVLPGWELFFGNTTDRICNGDGYVSSVGFGSWYYYRFRGTNVTAYVLQAPDAAQLEVFIDDIFQARISSYNASVQDVNSCQLFQYNSPILPYAQHVITLYHNGAPPERPNGTVYMRVNKFIHTVPDNATVPGTTTAPLFTPGSTPLFSLSDSPSSTSSSQSSSPPSATAASSSSSTGAIVGGAVGGVLGIAVVGLVIALVLKNRNKKSKPDPTHMVSNQNLIYATNLSGGGMQAPMITPLVLPAQGQTTNGPSTNSTANFNSPDQPYNPQTFASQSQVPSTLPTPPTNQFYNDAIPPFNPYYHSGASSTAASSSPHTDPRQASGTDEKSGGRRTAVSNPDHRNRSQTSLSAATSQPSHQFTLSTETTNRLSAVQLSTIQQLVERGAPAAMVATLVDSMLNPRNDDLSPTTGAPPAYVPRTKQ